MPDKEKILTLIDGMIKEAQEEPQWKAESALKCLKKELLKEQEVRVMTLDELRGIYVEFKGNVCPIRLSNFDLQKIIMYADSGVCRLWTAKPTGEQMEATKWE